MSSLYAKRGWVYLSYRDQFGRKYVKALGLKATWIKGRWVMPTNAIDLQRKIDSDIALGKFGYTPKVKAVTLSKALEAYLESQGGDLRESTKSQTRLAVRRVIKILGDMTLDQYTTDSLYSLRNTLKKNLSDQTVSFYLRAISPIFSWAVEKKYIASSPYVRALRRKPETPQPVTFSVEQLETVMREVADANPDAARQLRFILLTGARNTASCLLKWEQIDFNAEVIYGLNLKSKRRRTLQPFPLYAELAAFLESLPRTYAPFVFRYRERSALSRAVGKVRDRHGYPRKLNVHAIRKYTATYLLRRGLKIELVADILGHADLNVTRNHYAAFTMEDKRQALDAAFKQIGG